MPIRTLHVVLLVCLCLTDVAWSQKQETDDDQLSWILGSVAAGERVEAEEVVPQLPKLQSLIAGTDRQAADLALRAIGFGGKDSAPAISVVCSKLFDSQHGTRSLAIDALVAMGEPAEEDLRKILTSSSARARSAAADAMRRLELLMLKDFETFAVDEDPRVRGVAAKGLMDAGKDGVPILLQLLKDDELSVAVLAVDSLAFNRSNPEMAIDGLEGAMSVPGLEWMAVKSALEYGDIAAKLAPDILALYSRHPPDLSWHDGEWVFPVSDIEDKTPSLRPEDMEVFRQYLLVENDDVRRLARIFLEKSIDAAGPQDLEMVKLSIDQFMIELQAPERSPENSPVKIAPFESIQLANLYWRTSHDVERYCRLIQRIIEVSDPRISRYDFSWNDFTKADCHHLRALLKASNSTVRRTALSGISEIGIPASILLDEIVEIASSHETEEIKLAFLALAEFGPDVAEKVEPVLLAQLHRERIDLEMFALVAGKLKLSTPEVRDILMEGLDEQIYVNANRCADALWVIDSNFTETAAKLLKAANEQGKPRIKRTLTKALIERQAEAELTSSWLLQHARGGDAYDRIEAINQIAQYGPAGKEVFLEELKEMFMQKHPIKVKISLAQAIYKIGNDESKLRRLAKKRLGAKRVDGQLELIDALVELGDDAERYIPIAVSLFRDELENAPDIISFLERADTALARRELKQLLESHDDWIKKIAKRSLLELLKDK